MAKRGFRIMDSDLHTMEPDSLWEKYLDEPFRKAAPRFVRTWRHPRSMAQYPVGHPARVAEIERRTAALPGLALAGNGYRGIGIPDCIHSAERAAEVVSGEW